MIKTWLPRWRQPIEQVNRYCEITTGCVLAELVDVNTAQHSDANVQLCSHIHYQNEIFNVFPCQRKETPLLLIHTVFTVAVMRTLYEMTW